VTNSDLRPLSLGEILDRTFSLYRKHFFLFVGVAALPQLAILAIDLERVSLRGGQVGRAASVQPVTLSRVFSPPDVALTLITFVVVYGLIYPLASGALVSAASDIYFGGATTIGASLKRSWGRLGRLSPVVLVSLVVTLGGLIFFIVPGVYLACRLITSLPAAFLENLGTSDALKRSLKLTEDNAGRSFVIYVLYYCLAITAAGLLIYSFTYAARLYAEDPRMVLLWLSLVQLGSYFIAILLHPILTISGTVFYYDLRVRKEAFDLQLMMNQVGSTAPRIVGVPTTLT
jgi:hypothetical protein